MVESDYKNNRVSNPTKMSSKQIKAAKKFVLDFLNKAVHKRREHDKKKKEREEKKTAKKAGSTTPPALPPGSPDVKMEDDEDIKLSDDEMDDAADDAHSTKRKRDSETPATPAEPDEAASKKLKIETPPPPPPPPPPPAEEEEMDEGATPTQEPSPADTNGSVNKEEREDIPLTNGHRTPVQLATPSTNGSYETDLKVKSQQSAVTAGGL